MYLARSRFKVKHSKSQPKKGEAIKLSIRLQISRLRRNYRFSVGHQWLLPQLDSRNLRQLRA